ncbi:hypothetical protein KY290_010488 [Solanum tuberosum]|uniref:Uncharacterized protein n=1 Tax=Solanum tuberosum TaxID=4113 RepID=A0ABQ7VXX6_SOLTU|nr:hypothetical protein KY284_010370 [Solanum tuberosum]KAH0773351.1 hypothetical protein KY290_010488 [Solanum tuberosum]
MMMEERELDYLLVPFGIAIFLSYHAWLLTLIIRNPRRTVIGINSESRHHWVLSIMTDPIKNGVLAVQTIRNNIMASTLLATTAITLSSIISVFVSNKSSYTHSELLYYAHVSFLATVPTFKERSDSIEYVARNLNRGSMFWSLGLRAFYMSFPLFLWIFGPIPMFVGCCVMSIVLYFLDTTTSFTRDLHCQSIREKRKETDVDA